MQLVIDRISSEDKQTIGRMYVLDENLFSIKDFPTLELPWKDNQVNISCIPEGIYDVVKHVSPKFGECFWVKGVKGRSEILIHKGNYYSDIRGCILPGVYMSDINRDGHIDVVNSSKAMDELLELMPDSFKLKITASLG